MRLSAKGHLLGLGMSRDVLRFVNGVGNSDAVEMCSLVSGGS